MKTVVILPTYNERENIKKLVPMLQQEFKKIKNHDMHILVVDDKSPDGTADEVRKLQKKYKNVHLLLGDKKGLGVAYLRGFDYAIKKLKAEVMQMMDADLQHPPSMIPDFMKEIDNGNDFVVGSRYIPGGGTPEWNWKRKLVSWGGNMFARLLAGMYKVHDCTSGYRALRVSVFKKIDKKALHTRGYAFMSTLLYEMIHAGGKVKEIPLIFRDRLHGETKLRREDIIEFIYNSFRLRFKTMQRFIKFAIVGGSGIIVNLGIFSLAKLILYSGVGQTNGTMLVASLIGDELSILWNYFLNNNWTFKKSKNKDPAAKKIIKFHLIAITSVVINNAILFGLYKGFGMWDLLAKFIGILVAFLWNYFFNVKWTWRE